MPAEPDFQWYIVNVLSGYEHKVAAALTERGSLTGDFDEALVLQEFDSKRLRYPSTVFVRAVMTKRMQQMICTTPKVTGIVGGRQPMPLSEFEVQTMIHEGVDEGSVRYAVGETVRIGEGPFSDREGIVEQVDPANGMLRVAVTIHGRTTSVELKPRSVRHIG